MPERSLHGHHVAARGDQSFIAQEGDGWTVVSVIGGGHEVLMATTMVQDVEDSVPDAM